MLCLINKWAFSSSSSSSSFLLKTHLESRKVKKTTAETKEGYSTVNFSVVCIFLLHVFLGSLLCASDARLFFFRYTARSLFSSSISDFYSTFSLPGGDDEFDAFFFSCSIMVNTSFKKSKPSFMSSRSLSLRSLSSLSLKMSTRRMIGC